MDSATLLIVGSVSLVVTHLIMSHALRSGMIKQLGIVVYQVVYSIVSLVTLGIAIYGYVNLPAEQPLWASPYWLSVLCAMLMFFASILFVGSQLKNPAMPIPDADELARTKPQGVFKITRHPMMWAFALWGVSHILAKPTAANMWLMGSIAILALVGAMGQEGRKAREMGDSWRQWRGNTSFIPFGKGLVTPGSGVILIGIGFWMIASWAHHGFGYAMVPPWVNLWA